MTILKAIIATLLFVLLNEIVGAWILLDWDNSIYIVKSGLFFLIGGIFELIFVAFFIYKAERPKTIIPKTTNFIYYIIALTIGIFFIYVQGVLNLIYNLLFGSKYNTTFYYEFDLNNILSISSFATLLFIPIAEELFFRRYMLHGLLKNYKAFVAIFIAAILFASIHLNLSDLLFLGLKPAPHRTYIAFFGGVLSGLLYYQSKSIGPSIVFHIMWNTMASLVHTLG